MRRFSRLYFLLFAAVLGFVAAIGFTGCAHQYGSRYLPLPENAPRDPYGAYVHVDFLKTNDLYEGELLAIEGDSLFLVTPASQFIGIHRAPIYSVLANTFNGGDKATRLGLATTALVILAPFTVGFYSLLAMPLYLIVGLVEANNAATASRVAYYSDDAEAGLSWKLLARWARFPGGLPSDFSRARVHISPEKSRL